MNKDEADVKNKARVNVYLDKELIKRAKFKALEKEITLTKLIEDSIEKYLEK